MSLLPEIVRLDRVELPAYTGRLGVTDLIEMFRQIRDQAIADMARKPLDLPMEVAKAFVRDMRAYFAEPNAIKRDEIAARQLHALRQYQGPRDKKLRVTDVIEMFRQIKDRA
jgi:hypothetical protein